MKSFVFIAIAMLAIPSFAENQAPCKAFFQVLHAQAGTPGLRPGLDQAQKSWWESHGQRKYPSLCLDGSITSGDKPRYLVIWSESDSISQTSLPPNEVYGQTASALQGTSPTARIYQSRWNMASVTIVNVLNEGSLMLPPIYFQTARRRWLLWPDSRKVLEAAVEYLSKERVFLSEPD